MAQENKELLFKDLCARIPYGVKVQYYDNETKKLEAGTIVSCTIPIDETNKKYPTFITRRDLLIIQGNTIEDIKPYLFPLSSMTEEQRKELYKIGWYLDEDKIYSCFRNYDDENHKTHTDCFELINWCYKNNFDINDLIPMGLAIDATGLNIY